ncbi:Uncharacterised protein [Bordetella pertussis]|nr:Uncharacterised protein [Bordetella pertussis]
MVRSRHAGADRGDDEFHRPAGYSAPAPGMAGRVDSGSSLTRTGLPPQISSRL